MKQLFRRGLALFLVLVLGLQPLAPALAAVGSDGIKSSASQAASHRADDEAYIPIVPPSDLPTFLTETQAITTYLANLPIEQQIVTDVLEKILEALVVTLGDLVSQVLKSFGIDFDIDLSQLSFKFILDLLHLYSYAQDGAVKLLENWTIQVPPDAEETVRRFYLAQTATKVTFNSALRMGDDMAEGLYDVIDLVLGATKTIDKIGDGMSGIPGVGAIIARIKCMINQRIVFAFQNGVQLVTAPLSEPLRSRIRAVATALATTYIKWKDLQLSGGFGGINAATVTKVGFAVMGKAVLLMSPKIGFVAMTQKSADLATLTATTNLPTGTWDQARKALLDDEDDATEVGYTELVMKTTMRKSKLSRLERQAANVAGAISQIAQLVGVLDPSSLTKIVAVIAGVLAGGLQLHSIFNSTWYFYHLPGQLKGAVAKAFNPPGAGSAATMQSEQPDQEYVASNRERLRTIERLLKESHGRFTGVIEEVAQASADNDPEILMGTLERLDTASTDLCHRLAALGSFQRTMLTSDEQLADPLYKGLLDHQLRVADLFCKSIPSFALDQSGKRSRANRALLDGLARLEQTTSATVVAMKNVLAIGMVESSPCLELDSPGALRLNDMMKVSITVSNPGGSPMGGVQVRLCTPEGYRATSNTVVTVGTLSPGQEKTLTWTLVGSASRLKRGCVAFFAQSSDGLFGSRYVHLSR